MSHFSVFLSRSMRHQRLIISLSGHSLNELVNLLLYRISTFGCLMNTIERDMIDVHWERKLFAWSFLSGKVL